MGASSVTADCDAAEVVVVADLDELDVAVDFAAAGFAVVVELALEAGVLVPVDCATVSEARNGVTMRMASRWSCRREGRCCMVTCFLAMRPAGAAVSRGGKRGHKKALVPRR